MAALFAGRDVAVNRHAAFEDTPSLAERFAAGGWSTHALVANPLLTAVNGYARGFERYEVAPARSTNDLLSDLRTLRAWDAAALVSRVRDEFLELSVEKPLFLYVHFMDPHLPYDPAHESLAEPQPGWSGPDDAGRFQAFVETPDAAQQQLLSGWRRSYDGQVAFVDSALTRLVDLLELRRPRPRLIVVLSDHGEGLFDHRRDADSEDRPGPLGQGYEDHGEMLHEEALRVPLVLLGPGIPAGRIEPRPVTCRDVGATLLALAGLPAPGPLLPLDPSARVDPLVFGCSTRGSFVRSAEWKYVEPDTARLLRGIRPRLWRVGGGDFLAELEDYSEREPELAASLRRALQEHAAALQENAPAGGPDPETLQRLRQLGYVR